MKKNPVKRYVLAILSAAFLVGLAVAPVQAGPAKAQTPGVVRTTGSEQNWDSVVAAARKEGKIALYALWTPKARIALTEAFKAKYGIDVEFTPFSRGTELVAKVQTEQRAGLYLADAFGAGSNTFLAIMKPAGLLGHIEPMLALPEITDGKKWRTGRVPFLDKDKTMLGMVLYLTRDIFYNADMIKKGEITDYTDMLKPQYRGKITMNDPSVPGAGAAFMMHLAINIWDMARAKDYLTQLVGLQQTVMQRNTRLQVEEIARGKYPLGLAPNPDNFASFLKLGSHLDVVHLKQGVRATSGAGSLAVPTKPAHPNAAKLFVNWLLSKEGQTVFSQGFGTPSLRADVDTTGINPIFLPEPGEKVWAESEDFRRHTNEVMNMVKPVIEAANK